MFFVIKIGGIMMLKVKKVTDLFSMKVYTDTGEYFGDIEESVLLMGKVAGWRVRATRNSILSSIIGGAKGVIVPHQFVKAIGDVVIISKGALPSFEEKEEQAVQERSY